MASSSPLSESKMLLEGINDPFYHYKSIFIDHRHIWDELEDVQEIASKIRQKYPQYAVSVRRRGRGTRKTEESYKGEYKSYIPIDKSNYVAAYIQLRKKHLY